MSKKEIFRRYILFTVSVFINALSIAVITKAMLGTSPISSVPFVLSLATPHTMGAYTIYMNFLFIVLETLMMGKAEIKAKKYELISQIPITLFFGLCIDLSMHILLPWLAPTHYLSKFLSLLVGCVLLGTGISLEVKANVAMVTGEYLVQIISKFTKKEFGFIKVCFDVTLVIIACALSLIFLHQIEGIREGTVIAALSVGPISHFLMPFWKMFDNWLIVEPTHTYKKDKNNKLPIIITITREFGSGGRVLGEKLAEKLNIKAYDKELIRLVAQESKLPEKYIADNEQKVSSNYLMHVILQDYQAPLEKSLSKTDALFVAQSRVIRKIAGKESCVIIGRCSDYILNDYPKESIIKIFCYTNKNDAIRRCSEEYNMTNEDVNKLIEKTNRTRINHYQYFTGRKWGDPHYYDLMINTGTMAIETACDLILKLYNSKINL